METCRCRMAMAQAFEETALALGGVVANYPIPEEAVWDLARAMDAIHGRMCARCHGQGMADVEDPDEAPHPAITHLLRQLQERNVAFCAPRDSNRGGL